MIKLINLLILTIAFTANANQVIKKVEPENWWVGMKNPALQILLYGDNVGHLTPSFSNKGVSLEKVVNVKNPNYLFLYLKLDKNVQAGTFQINLRDDSKVVSSISYSLLTREEDSANRQGFDNSDVMYLITPDRFANGDPSNDDIENMLETSDRDDTNGRHGGDIEGIRQSLDYLSDMGFNAIWLNPVLENNMHEYSYHGYAATDLYKVDARFGSNEEYKEFIAEADSKGIKVIMDMILNHVGSEHWFVKDKPTDDWINFGDSFVSTSHRRNTIQDLYASNTDKKHFSDGWFVKTMPDLNQRNELLADYLIQNTIWWIEYGGLSGIRMDTYPYPDKDFMSDWTCKVMNEYPRFNIVGEEWVNEPSIVSYWQRGKVNHDGYKSCLPSLMDFPLQDALTRALTEEERTYGSGLIESYKMLARDFLYPDPDALVIFPDNHDMDRFFTQVNEDVDLFKMGLVYILTMRGTPQLYYGTEILMNNSEAKDNHGVIRSDFPGGWAGDSINAFTGKNLTTEQRETQNYLKTLLNWRKDTSVIHTGKLMHFTPENGLYVYFRYNDDEKIMVVINKHETSTSLDLSRFEEMLSDSSSAKNILTGSVVALDKTLTVAGKTASIFEVK